MVNKRVATVSVIALAATAGSIVYFVGDREIRIAGQGVVRFTRTALTVSYFLTCDLARGIKIKDLGDLKIKG